MVHKYKSFPVGKAGQRNLKKQIVDQQKDGNKNGDTPKPFQNADLGTKLAHMHFLSILGSNAHSQMAKKGGRKTRIDPLSLKQIADNLLRDIESKAKVTTNEESSDEEDSYASDDHSY